MDKSILINIAGCYQNRNHHRYFSGDNFTSKNFKELSPVETFFNIKQDYGVQPRTLLNFITDDLTRVF